jgi:hypothetical protein
MARPSDDRDHVGLKRELGLFSAVSVIVAVMIGKYLIRLYIFAPSRPRLAAIPEAIYEYRRHGSISSLSGFSLPFIVPRFNIARLRCRLDAFVVFTPPCYSLRRKAATSWRTCIPRASPQFGAAIISDQLLRPNWPHLNSIRYNVQDLFYSSLS